MKIGFDAKRAFANKTGLGNYSRFVLEILLEFNKKKHQILAFTPQQKDGFFEDFPQTQLFKPRTKVFAWLWRVLFIGKELQKREVSVFHGLSNEIPFFLSPKKIKQVVTIHDLIFLRFPQYYKPIDRYIYKLKFRYACHKAHAVVAISEQTKRDIMMYFGIVESKIHVIYQNCSDVFTENVSKLERQKITQKYNLQKPFIISVGSIEPRKNQLNLVKAFHSLEIHNHELVLVGGGGAYKAKVQAYIEKHEVKNVRILSHVPTSHLPALYQSATFLAYVSLFEGFGIPILEALTSGIPVLAAKGSCLEEAGGEGGVYVDGLSVNQIAEGITLLLQDASLRHSLIEKGKRHLMKFNNRLIAQQLYNLYEKLKEDSL
jgi:glycosyltransferase involved in cell wall biosynthesis